MCMWPSFRRSFPAMPTWLFQRYPSSNPSSILALASYSPIHRMKLGSVDSGYCYVAVYFSVAGLCVSSVSVVAPVHLLIASSYWHLHIRRVSAVTSSWSSWTFQSARISPQTKWSSQFVCHRCVPPTVYLLLSVIIGDLISCNKWTSNATPQSRNVYVLIV